MSLAGSSPARLLEAFCTAWITLALAACATLPLPDETGPLPEQYALAPAGSGLLADIGHGISATQDSEVSGFRLLDSNADALTWRLALLDSAQSSIDILYYLWHGDTGRLLLKRTVDAADRGVQVRLVIDDLILIGKDKTLAAIQQHPNIELRLFNPKRQRKLGMVLSGLADFQRVSARMHDKLIVADNHAMILGGRNIGDEYFGLNPKFNFHDLDVLGFGPVAMQASDMFDHFWNSRWVVSAEHLPVELKDGEAGKKWDHLLEALANAENLDHFPVEPQDWKDPLSALAAELHFGSSEIVYDRAEDDALVMTMPELLGRSLVQAQRDIRIINAYLIPGQGFIDGLAEITGRGVEVRILTNSLGSHDVPAVNSQYKLWRKPLVQAGAELYEFHWEPAIRDYVDTPPVTAEFSGLHTKSFVVDGRRVFIGSMNFDPRSVNINTEMGILIDSPSLGAEMVRVAERDMAPGNAWRVTVGADGQLAWTNAEETVDKQPARTTSQRIQDAFFRVLPKSQL